MYLYISSGDHRISSRLWFQTCFVSSLKLGEDVLVDQQKKIFFWCGKTIASLPEANSSASKRWHPKRKVVFQTSIFRGYILYMLVLGRVVFHLGLFIRRAAKKTPSFRAWTAIGLWWCTRRIVFRSAEGVELPEAQGFFVGKCIWAEDGPEMLEFLWFLLSLQRRDNFTQKNMQKTHLSPF